MDITKDNDFNHLIDLFKNLKLSDKKRFIEQEFHEILAAMQKLYEIHGWDFKLLYNREILDMKKEDATDDDFAEAVYVYLHSIEDLLASYIEKMEG